MWVGTQSGGKGMCICVHLWRRALKGVWPSPPIGQPLNPGLGHQVTASSKNKKHPQKQNTHISRGQNSQDMFFPQIKLT